jgi:hypothetical protein
MTVLAQHPAATDRFPEAAVDRGVLDAFTRNPTLAWTPRGLATWHGIHIEIVEDSIDALLQRGMIRANGHGSYVLALDPPGEN